MVTLPPSGNLPPWVPHAASSWVSSHFYGYALQSPLGSPLPLPDGALGRGVIKKHDLVFIPSSRHRAPKTLVISQVTLFVIHKEPLLITLECMLMR